MLHLSHAHLCSEHLAECDFVNFIGRNTKWGLLQCVTDLKKIHLLLRILAVIGRFGPLLTIVIFVTQNNFKNGLGISDRLLGFYQ